ncbi:hypothetical protein P3342_004086 [Pyrenophora teres f. teres]|uniref:Uncharacterized protein n=1 Tax=Pyrenophora teres f. teres TaxID=97479 RepID=A0A6S6VFD7_9PLEO|nr:hypothetical protein P3342_004086 [Pyrenophora teres f. teres]CAE7015311.1 hypothetical protein PTTW11_02780 [Pyrenophora teres f. teres]
MKTSIKVNGRKHASPASLPPQNAIQVTLSDMPRLGPDQQEVALAKQAGARGHKEASVRLENQSSPVLLFVGYKTAVEEASPSFCTGFGSVQGSEANEFAYKLGLSQTVCY